MNHDFILTPLQATKSIRGFGEARLHRHRLPPSDDKLHAISAVDDCGSGGRGEDGRRSRSVSTHFRVWIPKKRGPTGQGGHGHGQIHLHFGKVACSRVIVEYLHEE